MNMKVNQNQNTTQLIVVGVGGAVAGAATGIGVYYFFFVRHTMPSDIKAYKGDKVYTDADKIADVTELKSNAACALLTEQKIRCVVVTSDGNLLLVKEKNSIDKVVPDMKATCDTAHKDLSSSAAAG